jgi:hypothetical protein
VTDVPPPIRQRFGFKAPGRFRISLQARLKMSECTENLNGLLPGEFMSRVVTLNGQPVGVQSNHGIGYPSASHAAEDAALDESSQDGDVCEVDVTDFAGVTRRFRVVVSLEIKGAATEMPLVGGAA